MLLTYSRTPVLPTYCAQTSPVPTSILVTSLLLCHSPHLFQAPVTTPVDCIWIADELLPHRSSMFQQRFICQISPPEPLADPCQASSLPLGFADLGHIPRRDPGFINPSVLNAIFRSNSTRVDTHRLRRSRLIGTDKAKVTEKEPGKENRRMPGAVLYETPSIYETQEWSGRLSREKAK